MNRNTLLLKIACGLFFLNTNALKLNPSFKFHQTKETLDKIYEIINKKQKGGYFRFGDGELYIATGKGNAWDQEISNKLKQEMVELIQINEPTVLRSLPLTCKEFGGYEQGMYPPGNHDWSYENCKKFYDMAQSVWGEEITDVYSQVALLFASTNYPNHFIKIIKLIKNKTHPILVGNQNIPMSIRNKLFGTGSDFVPTPDKQAYQQINLIIDTTKQKIKQHQNDYCVVITAMGAAGRSLQLQLWKEFNNIFLLDFGSLMDAFCGWNTRAWIQVSKFNAASLLSRL